MTTNKSEMMPDSHESDTSNTIKKKRAMIEALIASANIVSTAAKKANISRETHYKWVKDDSEYAAMVEDVKEVVKDMTESRLYELIHGTKSQHVIRTQKVVTLRNELGVEYDKVINVTEVVTLQDPPNTAAVIYWMKQKAKDRGYSQSPDADDEETKNANKVLIIETGA